MGVGMLPVIEASYRNASARPEKENTLRRHEDRKRIPQEHDKAQRGSTAANPTPDLGALLQVALERCLQVIIRGHSIPIRLSMLIDT